jgi:mono/diheme cytochrome c family protein
MGSQLYGTPSRFEKVVIKNIPKNLSHIAALAMFTLVCETSARAQSRYGIGRAATPAEIASWNIDVDRYGNDLPPGSGSVSHGREVFDRQCAARHGAKGRGRYRRPTGGRAGHACDAKAGENRRQLLAVRPDLVRLYPPRHAAERAAIPE